MTSSGRRKWEKLRASGMGFPFFLMRSLSRRIKYYSIRTYRNYTWTPSPLASDESARNTRITVCVHDDYEGHEHLCGLGRAIPLSTPNESCVWGDVAFVRPDYPDPDWHVIMSAIDRSLKHVDIIASPNRVVFAVCEPATRFHANIHKAQGEHTIVLTHNRDYIENPPGNRQYIEAAALCPTWTVERNYDYLRTNHVTEKTHLLSWVTSNASIMPQHRYRLRFLQKLKQSTLPLDLYGRGFSPIADKWNGIAPYRYSIAFENAFMENYVTEKIMDCFVAETMPLYVGAPNVTDFFPKESMVIIDPDDPDIIRILEDIVHSDRYKKNRDAILEAKRIVLEECNTTARIARFVSSYKAAPLPKKPIRIYRRHQDWTGSEDVEYDRHKGYVPK